MAIVSVDSGLRPDTLMSDYGRTTEQTHDAFVGVYGSTIPLHQGARAIVGVPIWFGPLQESFGMYSAGPIDSLGRKPWNAWSSRKSRNFAVAFGRNLGPDGEHADPQIKRIWIDGALAYDASGGLPIPVDPVVADNAHRLVFAYARALSALKWTLYPGTQTQQADPLMKADKGDLCSNYKGLIYVVFKDMTIGTHSYTDTDRIDDPGSFDEALQTKTPWTAIATDWIDGEQETHLFGTGEGGEPFPQVQIEFVDGSVSSSSSVNISGSVFSNGMTLNNWGTRTAKMYSDLPTAHLIHTIDLNAELEVSAVKITGTVDGINADSYGWSGFIGGACCWDVVTNYIYVVPTIGNSVPIVAINADTGVISSFACSASTDLSPADVAHASCYTNKTDCKYFPFPRHACICYALDGSTTPTPVICMGLYDLVAIPVPTAGSLPSVLPYGSFFNPGAFTAGEHVGGMSAVPISQIAVARGLANLGTQDIAFFYMHGSKFELAFFSIHGAKALYLQSTIPYDAGTGRQAEAVAFDPTDGAAIFFHSNAGSDWKITRMPMVFGVVSVPGFRGQCPSFSAATYTNLSIPTVTSAEFDDTLAASDISQGTMGYSNFGSVTILDLSTGNWNSINYGGSIGSPQQAWDSKTNQLYGASGGFYKKVPLTTSLSGTNALPLSTYLRWLGLQAGYSNGQISVDPKLTDPVDGAMILRATDASEMWNTLGQLYDFTTFETGGTLKFVAASHNPLKANNTLNMGQPNENDQILVGTKTYRFTANPSVINDVKIASTAALSAQTLVAAINATGVPGQDYFPGLVQNDKVEASLVAGQVFVQARSGGTIGNTIPSTVPVGAMTWSHAATLTGGDVPPVPTINLTPADMAPLSENTVASDNEVIVTTLNTPDSVPRALSLDFWDEDQSYQRTTTSFQPDASVPPGSATDIQGYKTPFVMRAADAYRRVSKLSIRATQAAVMQEFRLPWKYLALEPSDVVGITLAPFAYVVRLDECTINADFSVSCSGMNYSFRDDIPVPDQPNLGLIAQTVQPDGNSIPVVLDMPLFDPSKGTTAGRFDVEVGVIAAQTITASFGTTFGTAIVSSGSDTANAVVAQVTQCENDIKYGTALTALPDTTTPFQTDNTNTLTLVGKTAVASLFRGGTQLDALAGRNCIVIGAAGRWEVIYFRDVTVVSEKVVTIGGLLRGRRGTEINTGSHVAGEIFYLMASLSSTFAAAVVEQFVSKTEIGLTYRYVSASVPVVRTHKIQVTYTGLSLYPFAPCRLKAVLNQPTNNDLLLSWLRRDRGATHWVTLPTELSETSELYDLDIYSGGSIVRSLTNLATPAYTYTVAQQTTDGFVAPLTTLKFAVYQKGELGRGFQRLETVNVS